MKKVVHLTSAHHRYDQRILWRECCSLREHGYDVTLIVNDAKESETLENGVRILSTGFLPQGRRERMTEGVKRVYTLGIAQNADIYHLHDAELLTIALKLKRNGKKVIFDSHEFYGETIKGRTWIPGGCRYLVSFLYNCYETYVCKRIDGVIAVGKYDGKDWFANRSKRFTVVGNFPPKDEYQDIPIPSYRLRANICYAGGLSEETGVLNLLEAAAKAKTRLLLAGRFSSEAFHEKCVEHDTNHVVDYFGQIGRKEVFTMYGKCVVGMCIPLNTGGQEYKINTLNTKIYEYMAMEMPVILSDWPYRRQMIEKYNFGLVANPSDIDDIAAKIRWILDHPKEAEEMGKNGKRLLDKQFTWENAAEPELLRMYQAVYSS